MTSALIRNKISLLKGDITKMAVDCIVNAANSSLLGGGGVDGAIHRAAGSELLDECRTLNGCEVGEAKITKAYNIENIRAIIHTVGPEIDDEVSAEQRDQLRKCYQSSLDLAKKNSLRSIAFPCISTGIYNFPKDEASQIALKCVKQWLGKNNDAMDKVIFCVFNDEDLSFYEQYIPQIFNDHKVDSGKTDCEAKKMRD